MWGLQRRLRTEDLVICPLLNHPDVWGKCGGIQGGRQMAPLTVDGHQLAIGILRTPELSECSYQLS